MGFNEKESIMKINIPLTVTGSIALIALSAKLITSAVSDIQDIKDAADLRAFVKRVYVMKSNCRKMNSSIIS